MLDARSNGGRIKVLKNVKGEAVKKSPATSFAEADRGPQTRRGSTREDEKRYGGREGAPR